MAIRLKSTRPEDRRIRFSETALHWLCLCVVCLGTLSVAVIQRGQLHLDDGEALAALNQAVMEGGAVMSRVSMSVLYAALAMLALPVYAKLLTAAMARTENRKAVLLYLTGCALLSEAPYDWAIHGQWFDLNVQNPVWGLLLAGLMLAFFQEKQSAGLGPKILMACGAAAWALLLRVYTGPDLVLLCALMALAEKKWVVLAGGAAVSLLHFPAPLGMFLVPLYDEQSQPAKYWLFALLYPAHLLLCGVLGLLVGG